MNLDPHKSEYSLVTYSPVKHAQSQALKDEVEAFLAQGGKIKQVEVTPHVPSKDALFRREVRQKLIDFLDSRNCSRAEFAALARTAVGSIDRVVDKFDTPPMSVFRKIDQVIERVGGHE